MSDHSNNIYYIENLQHAINIGIRQLQTLGAILDFEKNVLRIRDIEIPLTKFKTTESFHTMNRNLECIK